jgi:hypothetical protein
VSAESIQATTSREAPSLDTARWAARLGWLTRVGWPQSLVAGLVGGVVVFWLRTLPIVSDPFSYVHTGMDFPHPTWNMVGTTRYGIVLPLVPITRLFHDSEATFYLMPVVASIVLLASAHWLASRTFGRAAGVVAVVLLLGCSPILLNATRLYPDIFSASTTTLAVAVAVATRDRWRRRPDARLGGVVLLVLTGLAVGLTWWMRETSVFAWPAVAVALLWKSGPPRRLVALCAGGAALAMFVLEMVISALVFDDPMARLNALTGSDMSTTTNPLDLPYLNQGRLSYFAVIPRVMLTLPDGAWLVICGALAVAGALLAGRRIAFFTFWFLSTLVLLILAGGTLNPASPSLRLDLVRYWLPFLVPMILAATGALALAARAIAAQLGDTSWLSGARRRAVLIVVAAGLVLAPVLPTVQMVRKDPQFVVTNGGIMNDFRDWLGAHRSEVKVMYADLATQRQLPTYARTFWGSPLADVKFRRMELPFDPKPGSYVVFFSENQSVCLFCADWEAQIRAKRPHITARWDLVWRSRDSIFKIYRVPDRPAS